MGMAKAIALCSTSHLHQPQLLLRKDETYTTYIQNRSVMAYHYYTPPQGENTSAGYYHNWVVPNAERLGTGQMLTEFDRATPEQDFANFENFGLSWAWWEWKSFCKETKNTKNSLSQYAAWGSCKTGYGGVFPVLLLALGDVCVSSDLIFYFFIFCRPQGVVEEGEGCR